MKPKKDRKRDSKVAIIMVQYDPMLIEHALGCFENETGFRIDHDLPDETCEQILIETIFIHGALKYSRRDWKALGAAAEEFAKSGADGSVYGEMRLQIPLPVARSC